MPFNTPILFIIFNRPETAKRTFLRIKELAPSKLYIVSDGPRSNVLGENELVEATRKIIISLIDWPCDVNFQFREKNIGCSLSMYSAISWLFENEERGIILEDDCVPQKTFFPFCEDLLERYNLDNRVGMIAGMNMTKFVFKESYCFSRYKACWGWATWRRAWQNMDLEMLWRTTNAKDSIISNMGYKSKDVNYWKYRLKMIDRSEVSAWDWQWYFSMATQNQLCIFPKNSLISNTGFGIDATHTSIGKKNSYLADKEMAFPLTHPRYIVPNVQFDKAFYKMNNSIFYTLMRFVPLPAKHLVKKLIRRLA